MTCRVGVSSNHKALAALRSALSPCSAIADLPPVSRVQTRNVLRPGGAPVPLKSEEQPAGLHSFATASSAANAAASFAAVEEPADRWTASDAAAAVLNGAAKGTPSLDTRTKVGTGCHH